MSDKMNNNNNNNGCVENDAGNVVNSVRKTSPYHRGWLKEVLQKHKEDERVKEYAGLRAKYPILEDKALVCAPMVDASDLPFRMLCRRYNTNLCFTPMIHAKMFREKEPYRKKFWDYVHSVKPEDRPLIAQLCGSDKDALVYVIEAVQNDVDGVDLNCGCPQSIAKRGHYGAFLLEKGDLLVDVVHHLVHVAKVKCPVSVKVRLLPTEDTLRGEGVASDLDKSLKLYTRLVEAGAAMLTVHARNRFHKLRLTGRADWNAIRSVVQLLGHAIPIIANGNISNLDDVRECLQITGADGVMSSEGLVEYPALFTETGTLAVNYQRTGPGRLQLSKEYVQLCQQYPPELGGQGNGVKCVRAHLHRFLRQDLQKQPHVRDQLTFASDYPTVWDVLHQIETYRQTHPHNIQEEALSWYTRHRIKDDDADEEKKDDIPNTNNNNSQEKEKEEAEAADCCSAFFGNINNNLHDDGDY